MTASARVLWVDDAITKGGSTTQAVLTLMRQTKGLIADARHPNALETALHDREFDLFLVDYRLSKEPDENQKKYRYTGISVGGLIRDRFPDLPIYLTSALIDEAPEKLDSELFDRVVTHSSLTKKDGIAVLRDDAVDFKKIRNTKHRTSVKSVHQLLRTPKSAHLEVERVLPEDLRRGLGAREHERANTRPTKLASGTIQFGRWVMNVFLANPGVLYDQLYSATYLGMTESYFLRKFSKNADAHQYRGVFSLTHQPLWWKSGLTELVIGHPNAKNYGSLRIWDLAPKLFDVPMQARPKCSVCGKSSPETVAYDRDNPVRRGPAHLSCSEPDPKRQPVLYFEPYRVFIE